MAEDGMRCGRPSSGLAVILNEEDYDEDLHKGLLVAYCDDFDERPVERAVEYVLGFANKFLKPFTSTVDSIVVSSLIKETVISPKLHLSRSNQDGISIGDKSPKDGTVLIENLSICGDVRMIKPPFLVESLAMFSSFRANACVWSGKWMYEVILGTSGVQQLGWATIDCPFSDHKGVGDADDSYAFDGKRITKWNKDAEPYGQPWVSGDVIGCCIDLDNDEILFYRNGACLGLAFCGISKMRPGLGYYPAISLSQGERCELNFGGRPFKYPISGFVPLDSPPAIATIITHLLQCMTRLLDVQSVERADNASIGKLRRLNRFESVGQLFYPVCHGLCKEMLSLLNSNSAATEYIAWGPFLNFLLLIYKMQAPHDYASLDKFLDVIMEFQESHLLFGHIIDALSSACKTAHLVLTECPYSGSYPYLALACHLLRRKEIMIQWVESTNYELLYEGFLSQKSPSKLDLQCMIPSVWWPSSCDDVGHEGDMILATTALSENIDRIEEKHRELCELVIQFTKPTSQHHVPGSVFRTFLQHILLGNGEADRNVQSHGVSTNTVFVSLFAVILHFLSEGFSAKNIGNWILSDSKCQDVGFFHRGGVQRFSVGLILNNENHLSEFSRLGGSFTHISKCHPIASNQMEVMQWDEGFMDDEDSRVTHDTVRKPCCCSSYDIELSKMSKHSMKCSSRGSRLLCNSVREKSSHIGSECHVGTLNDEISDKPGTSQTESDYAFMPSFDLRILRKENSTSSAALSEEELMDALLLLYHIGVAPNFKQASYYMSHQTQSLSLLEETDRQIKEQSCKEQIRRLKETRTAYREDVIECVRHHAWYRVTLFSRWKQRGMYAMCMRTVHLLLVLSKVDSLFTYVPEFYVETLVDCFHALRKSDPPFVPSTTFINQGLNSFVTFIVSHFNDPRILSADLRDLLLQSISVLLQYKEHVASFERNKAAIDRMPTALLEAFDNRSWIPVTNIILRLYKGSRFGTSKHGEGSSSVVFQNLLREACVKNEELFSTFLNRLFNTLSWTMTEFSVCVREMQEKYQVLDFQQRKCCVIFDLSCNLARLLEFCTREIPQIFLEGTDTNLRRLTELIVFILHNITSAADSEFFDLSLRRHGQPLEKVNRGMILLPLLDIFLNLLDPSLGSNCSEKNNLLGMFASVDCAGTLHHGIQYLLEHNWVGSFVDDGCFVKLGQLESSLYNLLCAIDSQRVEGKKTITDTDDDNNVCCICYSAEADAMFATCSHVSCFGCISRHLLNCQRCFFCNATVSHVVKTGNEKTLNFSTPSVFSD